MRATLRRMRERRPDDGFTLIELLVVVVIIGVLVAIAVPVYLNYRQGAADKSAQSDVRGAVSAIEQYYSSQNAYPADKTFTGGAKGSKTDLGNNNVVSLSANTTMQLKVNGTTSYVVCATNSGGNSKVYVYNSGNAATSPSGVAESKESTVAACIASGS